MSGLSRADEVRPEDLAEWNEYWDWQDAADVVYGPGPDCGCCLSVRGRHCQCCHPEPLTVAAPLEGEEK